MRESKFYQEIMEAGRLVARRAAIVEVLEERFGLTAAAQFREALNHIEDEHQLSRVNRLAARSPSLADFRQAFPSVQARR